MVGGALGFVGEVGWFSPWAVLVLGVMTVGCVLPRARRARLSVKAKTSDETENRKELATPKSPLKAEQTN